ncbi:hypothetical protein [Ensifer sp. Root127]|uniref:hypothetical protein n=1 Tax=Ensifer sp. Root127 TaxID=1736440 RepID=UPI00070914DB|nr:hypothetical protein [Ensifer sp. Root127]KQW72517.1 hypothetical protein ASD03_31020 [Ensifer sp. Root127]
MFASAAQAFSLQLERTLELAGAFLLALLLVTITLTVVLRYAAASGFTGAEEAASWLLVALVSVGLPLASTAGGLRIDLFEGGSGVWSWPRPCASFTPLVAVRWGRQHRIVALA